MSGTAPTTAGTSRRTFTAETSRSGLWSLFSRSGSTVGPASSGVATSQTTSVATSAPTASSGTKASAPPSILKPPRVTPFPTTFPTTKFGKHSQTPVTLNKTARLKTDPESGKVDISEVWDPTLYNAITHYEFSKAASIATRNVASYAKYAVSPSAWVSSIVDTVKSLAISAYDRVSEMIHTVSPLHGPQQTAQRYWTQDQEDPKLVILNLSPYVSDAFDPDTGQILSRYTFDGSGKVRSVEHKPRRFAKCQKQALPWLSRSWKIEED